MPTDRFLKVVNLVHRGLLAASRGRLGWRVAGMPALVLTTTGRRSGRRRTVRLTAPVQDGEALVVVASRGGDDRHPAWFLNVQADPEVEVATGGRPARPMRARVASPEERAALWPRVVAAAGRYAGYQAKTDREIPLVLLEPREARPGRRPSGAAVTPGPSGRPVVRVRPPFRWPDTRKRRSRR